MKMSRWAPGGVEIERDEFGVPHIRTDDLEGAYWGMGYAHAVDRGRQMALMRLLGQGRVAECLDGSDESVEIDRFFRRMNLAGHTSEQLAELTPETVALLDAYCDGVNARFERRRPWEFHLLRYRPEPWSIEDSLLMTRMIGYVSLSQSQAAIERLIVEMVQAGVDDARLDALFPGLLASLDRRLVEQVRLDERVVPESIRWGGGTPRMMASNNWAVAPSRAATGTALLANDPHLEVNRLPNAFVEHAFELPDDTVFTANMPGIPGPLVGRTRRVAWGVTYAFVDAVDSWIEDCRDGGFRRGDEIVPFAERYERIRVKGGDPVDLCFYENLHGVLDGEPAEHGYRLATRWASAESGAATLNAVTEVWSAQSAAEVQRLVGRIETAWNWVIADDQGHIAYQMSGLCPIRHESANGLAPMPGWEPDWDWKGFHPPEALPRAFDPPDGVIVTANHDLNHLGDADPINLSMADYRARRITELLAEAPCDLATFARIQMDTYSIQAAEMMEILLPILPDTPVGNELAEWDFRYDPDSRGAVLFESFYRELLIEMFGSIGEPVIRYLADATEIFVDFYADFDRILTTAASPWLAGRSLESVYRAAFERVEDTAGVRWSDANQVVLVNILFGGRIPRWAGFDRGPISIPGGRASPHQGQVYRSGGRQTSFVPVFRMLADLGEDGLHTSLAGGPSDNRFSRWYVSDLQRWRRGEYKHLVCQSTEKDRVRG